MDENTKKVLATMPMDIINEVTHKICVGISKKSLSYRQAEALLEYAKDRLKDMKMRDYSPPKGCGDSSTSNEKSETEKASSAG